MRGKRLVAAAVLLMIGPGVCNPPTAQDKNGELWLDIALPSDESAYRLLMQTVAVKPETTAFEE